MLSRSIWAALACLAFIGHAHGGWSNAELDARHLPNARWNAISAADHAECSSHAAMQARSAVAQPKLCNTAWDFSVYQQCLQINKRSEQDSERLEDTFLKGCMARKGWVWPD